MSTSRSRAEEFSLENAADLTPAQPQWFGHPPGLAILFLTQMWEQFSFFGMRALLVYYMTKQLMLSQQTASMTYGLYAASVYFTPIVGGLIADRWLGRRAAVLIGGMIMASGHLMMASENLFHVALVIIAIGNGLFLPSLPSQISDLYAADDPRRHVAYNVYYVGINLGAFLAPLACGTVGEFWGWHWGFTLAGLGMLTGLGTYILGRRYLPPERSLEERHHARASSVHGWNEIRRITPLLIGIAGVIVLFRGAYEQVGNTIALWAGSGIDRTVGGTAWSIPMTWFQALNPLMVFILTPPLLAWWTYLAKQKREPLTMTKMAIGAAIVAFAFLLVSYAVTSSMRSDGQVSWSWLALFFVILTLGELFILPVGLGLFARLAPAGYSATTVAAWFFAGFAGNLLAGALGSFWSSLDPAPFFLLMAATAMLSSAALLLFRHSVKRAELGC